MSKIKQEVVDMYCPNVFYDTDIYALGEIKTWDEYEKHPLSKNWNIRKELFDENTKRWNFHFITYFQKLRTDNEKVILFCTYSDGDIRDSFNMDREECRVYTYEGPHIEKIKEHFKKPIKNEQNVDISKEGYKASSELFSFKDLKRTVIEHGKKCYIEGYKKHAESFYTFLIKNGYFSNDELEKIQQEFNTFRTQGPELTIETVGKYLRERNILAYQNGQLVKNSDITLTKPQNDVLKLYNYLNKDVYFLRIQKPRQKGVTTILKIIAQIEALNNKNVLYAGYGPCEPLLKKIKNITYKQINSYCSLSLNESFLLGKKYDVIIIDEITSFDEPYMLCDQVLKALSDSGKIVLVGTPFSKNHRNYEAMEMFFSNDILNIEGQNRMISYTIIPNESDYALADKYPERKNEILGQFFD